jgi:hypothetical protein
MTSVSEISNSLIYVNQNPRKIEELRNRTKEISDKFTWQNTVNNLIDLTKNIGENSIV